MLDRRQDANPKVEAVKWKYPLLSVERPRETGAKTQTSKSKPFGASTPQPKPELANFTYQ